MAKRDVVDPADQFEVDVADEEEVLDPAAKLRILDDSEVPAELREAMNGMELKIVDPRTVLRNPLNWHQHPTRQRWAFRDTKNEFGWGSAITINRRTGRLIDGEMRLNQELEEGGAGIPAILVDVPEESEAALLALMDRIGMLANTKEDENRALLEIVSVRSDVLKELLGESQGEVNERPKTMDVGHDATKYDIELAMGERYDYLVLLFRSDTGWIAALDHFNVPPVNDVYSTQTGIGRVIDGEKYLERVVREAEEARHG